MGKSIALFGTSADPPTIGHKKILEELSKIYAFTIGYVSDNPNKNHKEDISIRSHLLKTLIEDLDNPKILFNQSVSSQWAVESIKKCKRIYELNNLEDKSLGERKKEQLLRRKLSGNNLGGRPKISPLKESLVIRLRNEGYSYRSIRTQTGIALSTIRRVILE